jgi:hypothetical protein
LAVVHFEDGVLDNYFMAQVDKGIDKQHDDVGQKAPDLEQRLHKHLSPC